MNWIFAFRGETGQKGEQGLKGTMGITGDKGDKGDIGPQGYLLKFLFISSIYVAFKMK